MKKAYYNEFDPKAAEWLRELIKAGLIADGDVDERSIADVRADELRGYAQCHFFAGIGGWSLALRLAGVPDDEPVWTGSCPCQPFSAAGNQMGRSDPRHLWPAFRRLINRGGAPRIYGEQVASAGGRQWLAGVSNDLETMGFATASADLCSPSVGSPNLRQRIFWMGYAASRGLGINGRASRSSGHADESGAVGGDIGVGPVANSEREGPQGLGGERKLEERRGQIKVGGDGALGGMVNAGHAVRREVDQARDLEGRDAIRREGQEGSIITGESSDAGWMANANCGSGNGREPEQPREGAREDSQRPVESGRRGVPSGLADADGWNAGAEGLQRSGKHGQQPEDGGARFWDAFDVVPCSDGKARRVEPGTFPLAHGVSGRVGLLRGYGNAINPHVAAEFIKASEAAIAQLK